MVYQFEDKEKHDEYLKFFDELKSKKTEYGLIDKALIKGIGLWSETWRARMDDVRCDEYLTYHMNPMTSIIASQTLNLASGRKEDVEYLLSQENIIAHRCYAKTHEEIRTGFLGMWKRGFYGVGKLLEDREIISEIYLNFSNVMCNKLEIEPIHSKQLVYPLYSGDLERILTYI